MTGVDVHGTFMCWFGSVIVLTIQSSTNLVIAKKVYFIDG